MTDEELARRADLNYVEELRAMAVTAERGMHREVEGVSVALTGSPHAAFNVALIIDPLADIDRFITEALTLARAQHVPLGIATREHVTQELRPHLDELGYVLDTVEPSFVLHPLEVQSSSVEGVSIDTVHTAEDYDDWVCTQAEAFVMDVEVAREVFPAGLASLPGHELYLARREGEPVGSASLVVTDGMAGVYGVATLEAHRRQGIGRALTAHCLHRGLESGCDAACLQAYDAGRSLYLAMGFEQVGHYDCFGPAEV